MAQDRKGRDDAETIVHIPRPLHVELKVEAARRGMKLGALVTQVATAGLAQLKKTSNDR